MTQLEPRGETKPAIALDSALPTGESPVASGTSTSVVIAWVNPIELLQPGMEALDQQVGGRPKEIIVVTRHGVQHQTLLQNLFPRVTLFPAPPETPITALRALGLARAKGDVVAVIEDHCVPDRNWLATIHSRMADSRCRVLGGPVENAATRRLRDWAAFLTEYAGAIRAAGREEAISQLPGNNVAYRRELVPGLCETLDRGLWESFYHAELGRRGISLSYDPNMVVLHRRSFDLIYFVRQRFYFSRSFAQMRNQGLGALGRAKYAIGSFILPPLLLWRGLATLRRKGRYVGLYLVCLPLITLYVTVGTLGEMTGYAFGGGDSLGRVE